MELTGKQFRTISALVYDTCGINLHEGKMALLKNRLSKRLRATGIKSVDDYLELIRTDPDEFTNFVDTISTNHTYFFRENRHCEFLLNNIDMSRPIKLWSAASSSGEEPYSIAFQLLDRGARFEIVASDISTHMLKMAKRGIYRKDKLRLVPESIVKKYCQKGRGKWEGYVKVKQYIIDMITFMKLNLLYDPAPGIFDVIFCRNVMIYFDKPTKEKVVHKLSEAINPGGYLIIGASEGLVGIRHDLKYIEPSIYMKPD